MKKPKRGRPKSAEPLVSLKFGAKKDQARRYKEAAALDNAIALAEFIRRACDERADQLGVA